MPIRFALALFLIAALTACSQFPQLDETVGDAARKAPYPDLIPIEKFHAQIPDTLIEPTTAPQVEARVAQLKARAARLRGSVIDNATRTRMQQGVN